MHCGLQTITLENYLKWKSRLDLPLQKLAQLYAWPPRPLGALKWLLGEYLFPWVYLFVALAIISWYFFTPDLAVMKVLSWEWIAFI